MNSLSRQYFRWLPIGNWPSTHWQKSSRQVRSPTHCSPSKHLEPNRWIWVTGIHSPSLNIFPLSHWHFEPWQLANLGHKSLVVQSPLIGTTVLIKMSRWNGAWEIERKKNEQTSLAFAIGISLETRNTRASPSSTCWRKNVTKCIPFSAFAIRLATLA